VRYLILSDIHSNLEALEAVLEAAEGEYDRILCCGDLVGYGADPGAVVDWAQTHVSYCIRGNHDRAMFRKEDLEWFNPVASASAVWNRNALSEKQLRYLRNLPAGPQMVDGFMLFHGAPQDEDDYLLNIEAVRACEPHLTAQLSFFGHTHWQGGFRLFRSATRPIPKVSNSDSEAALDLSGSEFFLINPGSVGQPRDADPRAAFCIYSSHEKTVRYRRTNYDVEGAQKKILAAGLPPVLARRLGAGF